MQVLLPLQTMRAAANFFSWVLQPLLMPLYGTAIFLTLPFYAFRLMPDAMKWYVIICNSLFTFLLPVIMILLMLKLGIVKTVELENREDRRYPLLVTIIFHAANYYFLTRVPLPSLYYLFLLSGIFSLLLTLIVSKYWKISMHMTGIGGLCGSLLLCAIVWPIDVRWMLAGLFLAAGIVGSSRLILNAHTPAQVGAGFGAGLLPQLAILLIYLR
jgi:hypothetical protein